jgi:hypothetical protein
MEAPDAGGGEAVSTNEAMADAQRVVNQGELRLQRFREWLQVSRLSLSLLLGISDSWLSSFGIS